MVPPCYVQMADLASRIPGPFITQALDDNGDGLMDPGLWAQIQSAVAKEIDGTLSVRYGGQVPFQNPLPNVVVTAAIMIACEMLYLRRGQADNPFTAQAKAVRATLADIAAGKLPLFPTIQRTQPSASVQTAPTHLGGAQGAKLMS